MKKLFYLFLTLFALVGCDNKDEFDQIVQDNPEASELPQTLYATILNEEEDAQDTPQSRTYLNNNKKVVWHKDDEISFFLNNTHGRYVSTGQDGAEHVAFNPVSETTVSVANPPKYSLAVYPYDETITCERVGDQDKIHVTYPATQTYAGNTFAKGTHLMVSAGTIPNGADNNLRFRNACGYLVLKLYGNNTKVKSIALSGRKGAEKIAGAATIVAKSNAAPVTTMSDGAGSTVTLNCGNEGITLGADAANATEFWFMLPPVTFEDGIKVVVTEADGSTYTKETTKAVTVARNSIKPMAAFHVGSQLYYTTNSGNQLSFTNAFDATIKDHKYDSAKGKFVVSFHGTLTTIEKDAFKEKDITTIDIPNTVTTIEEAAFYEAANLTALTIPGSVNFIGYDAFYGCTAMTQLKLEPSPTNTTLRMVYSSYVGTPRSPFYASPLQSIHINRQVVLLDTAGNEITEISENTPGIFNLKEDEQINEVIIGEQLVNIPDMMFGTPGITSITIPSTVQSIGVRAFSYAKHLHTIVFEESAEPIQIKTISKSIEALPFARCPLTSITLKREVSYLDKDGNAYTPTGANYGAFSTDSNSDYLIDGYDELECDVTIGANVRTIHPYMFSKLHVKNVTMADGVTSIGEGAFYNCDKLINITIAGTVNSIANDVFYDCDNLSSVTFLPSPTNTALTMGYQTFGLDEQGPFYDASLTQVKLNRNINYTLYEKGGFNQDDEALFSGSDNSFSVEIGNQVTTIPPYVFAYSGITSVNIPVSVTAIKTNAFRDCKNLQTVVIEPSSEHIKISVQYSDDSYMTYGTFYQSPLRTIKLGRHIDYYSYDDATPLSPDKSSDGVFAKYSASADYTAKVEIGANVDAIHNYMFFNVPMQSVTIPANVDAIGKEAFYCSTLKNVTCEGSEPPRLDSGAFILTSLDNIYIPAGSWNSYVYSGKGWSTYQTKLRDSQKSQQ